jgi:hypothetical protein
MSIVLYTSEEDLNHLADAVDSSRKSTEKILVLRSALANLVLDAQHFLSENKNLKTGR